MALLSSSSPSLLQDQLDQVSSQVMELFGESDLIRMKDSMEKLRGKKLAAKAVQQGDICPDFELPDQNGKLVRLNDLVRQGPVVLAFYRGSWCPHCNLQLMALERYHQEFQRKGATLVAISPMLPDETKKSVDEKGLHFTVLSDVGNRVAQQFRLVFEVDETIHGLMEAWGMDLPSFNGDTSWTLPLPATYILEHRTGKILFSAVDENHMQRMEPADALAALPEESSAARQVSMPKKDRKDRKVAATPEQAPTVSKHNGRINNPVAWAYNRFMARRDKAVRKARQQGKSPDAINKANHYFL